jgi:7-cyano-7-deazaguanine reductase
MPSQPSKNLETFPNPNPARPFEIAMECEEFTCLCPMTGQPDFATIRLRYVPAQRCVELKSLKLYLWSFRNEGAFHEAVTNKICDDLVAVLAPRWIEVTGDFKIRGGIHTAVIVRQGEKPAGIP